MIKNFKRIRDTPRKQNFTSVLNNAFSGPNLDYWKLIESKAVFGQCLKGLSEETRDKKSKKHRNKG
jgi:hypothetical protein